MIKTQILCDFCEKPFITTPVEESEHGAQYIEGMSYTREWDTRRLFPHLCESCALKLDFALAECKRGIPIKAALMARNAELNTERREKLGTKG